MYPVLNSLVAVSGCVLQRTASYTWELGEQMLGGQLLKAGRKARLFLLQAGAGLLLTCPQWTSGNPMRWK